jgi:hypothetical protein
VSGIVVDRHASVLEQQLDQLPNLCGAVDPSRDADLQRPPGAVSDGHFEGRHVIGIPVGEEVAGLLIVDLDVEVAIHGPRVALPRQVPIERGDGLGPFTCREHEHAAHGVERRRCSFSATSEMP